MARVSCNRAVNKPRPLAEEVYEVLRRAILERRLPPNRRLVETQLAQEMGLSRTPVREALHRLVQEGLVSPLPRRGLVVRAFSAQELEEIFGIRQVLEGYAARLAAGRITERELSHLESLQAKSEECTRQGHSQEVVRLSNQFHTLLNRASGSQRLLELINTFREYFFSERVADLYDLSKMTWFSGGRGQILEALRARDGERAERSVREHLAESMRVLLGK